VESKSREHRQRSFSQRLLLLTIFIRTQRIDFLHYISRFSVSNVIWEVPIEQSAAERQELESFDNLVWET
jgi:hypothetical protein